MVSLKVDGLSHRTNTDDLEALFEKYGRIGDVYIPKVSLGYGFYIGTMFMLLNTIAVQVVATLATTPRPHFVGTVLRP
jgi:hypothetical protein